MFVTVSGSTGVGKTTLCNLFRSRNPGWEFLPEVIDTTIKPQDDPTLRQLWFLNQYVEREKRLGALRGRNIIADRDWIDSLVYARFLGGYELMERLFLSLGRTEPDLRVILTLPEEKILERVKKRGRDLAEKWRENDAEFVRALNAGFLDYYNGFRDLKPVVLLDGSLPPQELCSELEKLIRDHTK